MLQSLSQLYIASCWKATGLTTAYEMSGTERRSSISPLQGYELESAPLTQAVGLGCDRAPLWGLRQMGLVKLRLTTRIFTMG
jgi:hypothetical protein